LQRDSEITQLRATITGRDQQIVQFQDALMSREQQIAQLASLVEAYKGDRKPWDLLNEAVMAEVASLNVKKIVRMNPELFSVYGMISKTMEVTNPHLVYPTSIYQTSGGQCFSTSDSSKIEAFLSTTKTSSIRILNRVLDVDSLYLRNLYKPLSRCVCVIDKTVDGHWGDKLDNYFAEHGIELVKLVYRAFEADKHIGSVQKILEDYKRHDYTRITFYPDFAKFGMKGLDDGIASLMMKRVYDVAGHAQRQAVACH